MIEKKNNFTIPVNEGILLKLYSDSALDDMFTVAFWSIYKMIVLRNMSGKEEREKKLWSMFCHEISIRIRINQAFKKKGKKPLYNIPYRFDAFNVKNSFVHNYCIQCCQKTREER